MTAQYNSKRLGFLVVLICFVASLIFISHYQPSCSGVNFNGPPVETFQTPTVHKQVARSLFTYTLTRAADADNNVILAFVDSGFVDFAVNLYVGSFKLLGLKNHLFLASDNRVCPSFRKIAPGVNCIQSSVDEASFEASLFGSKGFVRKNWRKIKTVYNVLQMGFNVLLTDIDIVIFKDPFPYFKQCPTCDIQLQHDQGMICAGFYYVRSTGNSVELLSRVWKNWSDYISGVTKKANDNDQVVMNRTIAEMKRTVQGFMYKVLPVSEFANGNSYFQKQKLMFGTDGSFSPDVYMVHDNWIVSEAAKRYRFREHFMWFYDKDGYYGEPTRKYLQYDNPLDEGQVGEKDIHQLEKEALQGALTLGYLLNRVVILPSFTCKGCTGSRMCFPPESRRCALNAQFKVTALENNFENLYREHTFLKNSMVPNSVKFSVSETIVIETKTYKEHQAFYTGTSGQLSNVFKPIKPAEGATIEEVVQWFEKYRDVAVLRFHSFYRAVKRLPNGSQYKEFKKRLENGVKLHIGQYMQLA